MIKYYPYKSDKPNKNIILLQIIIKKFILVLVDIVILLYIKMKQENKDILIDIKIMKCGLNQVLIPPGSGHAGCYGIYKPLKIIIMTLKEDSIYNF